MPQRAHVSSVEAIELFRSRLLIYAAKAKPLLDDARDEVTRTREWLRSDRRVHWENELRRRKRQLDQAEQTYFSARFSTLRDASSAEQMAVHRARRAVEEAEEKLRRVKKWSAAFDEQTAPLLKQLEQLRTIIAEDLSQGAAYLAQVIKSLEAYAEVRRSGLTAPAADAATDAVPGPVEEPK